jgi:hypothetical protein
MQETYSLVDFGKEATARTAITYYTHERFGDVEWDGQVGTGNCSVLVRCALYSCLSRKSTV